MNVFKEVYGREGIARLNSNNSRGWRRWTKKATDGRRTLSCECLPLLWTKIGRSVDICKKKTGIVEKKSTRSFFV
jgi:hypothetical protein